MRRAIYMTFSEPAWVEVAARLASEGAARPVYWTGLAGVGPAVRAAFPDAVFHERFAAARGVPPAELASLDLEPLDEELLRALAHDESIVLKMMERMDIGDSFTYRERVRLYHDHVRYWATVLRRLRPDVVLFFSSPHFVYDYVCYALCRLRGIQTLVFKGTALPGWSLMAERIEAVPTDLSRAYAGAVPPGRLSQETADYLATLRGDYADAEPDYMRAQAAWDRRTSLRGALDVLKDVRGYPRRAARLLGLATRGLEAVRHRKRADTITKRRGRPVHETPTVLDYTLLKLWARAKQRRLKAQYLALTRPVDAAGRYVFCALHMQPERTTSPDGGVYVHQYLMVELLASALPTGWRLYVKEHASQFVDESAFDSSLAQSRSASFYRRIAALPNVDLVSTDASPFALIDGAQAVATVTGTVGWEAVVRGKPALAFGYPWYLGCEGVFHTPTLRELRAAMDAIAAGYRVDGARVELFAAAVEAVGFRAHIYDAARAPRISHERFVATCFEAVRRHLDGKGGGDAPQPDGAPALQTGEAGRR